MYDASRRTILIPRRAFVSFLLFLLAAIVAIPVLADYIGPDRTVASYDWERLRCHYQAVYDPAGPGYYGCSLTLYEPPDGSCASEGDVADLFNPAACVGWPGDCTSLPCDISLDDSVQPCGEGDPGCRAVEKSVDLPPATISGAIACTDPGSSGWCRGPAELSLSGSEPLSGETILAIEGTRNGEAFACSGTTCDVPLIEGSNSFTFWALSSYGDSSEMGNANQGVDSAAPTLSGELTGTAGDAGWFVSNVTVSASASDPAPGSGLAILDVSVDGGGWAAYSGPFVLGDGNHTVDLRALDVAGNSSQTTQSINVDTAPPEVDLSAGTAFCAGCGQTLAIVFSADDLTSGVASWSLTADGVGVASGAGSASQTLDWNGSGVGGGSHDLMLEARDAAGNTSSATTPFELISPTAEPEDEGPVAVVPVPGGVGDLGSTPLIDLDATDESDGGLPGATASPGPTQTPEVGPTSTPLIMAFGGLPEAPVQGGDEGVSSGDFSGAQSGSPAVGTGDSSAPVFGAAAAALFAGVTAVAVDRRRKRKAEEAALREEMARRNAAAQEREDAQRIALAAAAAAVAAAKAAEKAARREKAAHELAENEVRLAQLAPAATTPTATWQSLDRDLWTTQVVASQIAQTGHIPASQTPDPSAGATSTPGAPEATSTPSPGYTPSPSRAPYPPGFVPLDEPWPEWLTATAAVDGLGHLWKYAREGYHIYEAAPLKFAPLESGYVGVRVGDLVPEGERLARRLKLGYEGTRYGAGTLSRVTAGNLISDAAKNSGMVVPLVTSLATNVIEFGFGDQSDKGILSNEFAASTMVDFAVSGLTGVAAAGTVALAVAAAGALGATLIATAPLAAVLVATGVLGVGISLAIDSLVDIDGLKDNVASGLSAWGGIAQNALTIRNTAVQRVADSAMGAIDAMAQGLGSVGQAVTDTAGQVVSSIGSAGVEVATAVNNAASSIEENAAQLVGNVAEGAQDVADSVGGFIRGIFGGGDS